MLQWNAFSISKLSIIFYSYHRNRMAEQQPIDNNENAANTAEAGPKKLRSQFAMDFDNLDEELSKVPLFMTDLPTEENDTLAALQSLVFDGTPEGKKEPGLVASYDFLDAQFDRGGTKL